MKHFSKHWIASTQPRKQHKYRANAPNHIRRKFMASTLSKELRKKYSIRNIEVRKGDEVKIMRGHFAGKLGKVDVVDVRNTRVTIEGIQNQKKEGSKVKKWFHPSKLRILTLVEDKFRLAKKTEIVKPIAVEKKEEKKTEIKTKEMKGEKKKHAQ